jgi:hypothetical protein
MFRDDESVRRPLDGSPFTYGSGGLNPGLLQETEDDLPLAHLHRRRMRRGSEGIEIRPPSQANRELQVNYGDEVAAAADFENSSSQGSDEGEPVADEPCASNALSDAESADSKESMHERA